MNLHNRLKLVVVAIFFSSLSFLSREVFGSQAQDSTNLNMTGKKIVEFAGNFLAGELKSRGINAVIEQKGFVAGRNLGANEDHEFELSARVACSGEVFPVCGDVLVYVALFERGNAVCEIPVRFYVKQLKMLPVTLREIKRGEIIEHGDFTFVEGEVAENPDQVPVDSEIVGMCMRRDLTKGKTITKQDLSAPPLVKRGEMVEIVYEKNGLVVKLMGKSLEQGVKNEVIQVRNISSGKILECRVACKGVAKIIQ